MRAIPGLGASPKLLAAVLLLGPMACDQPLTPRREGLPLAPGEEREALPTWRVRDGLIVSTVIETGDPLTRNVSAVAPRFGSRLDGLSYWGDDRRQSFGGELRPQGRPEHGFLWVDQGEAGSWLRVERDDAHDWALTLTTSNSSHPMAHARFVTPWGSLWSTAGASDWPPDDSEDAALPMTGPAACGWEQIGFALSADGGLSEGAPIVLYALARGAARVFFTTSDAIQMIEEVASDPARSRTFARTRLASLRREAGSSHATPMASDRDGRLWFATGDEVFRLDADSEGAEPELVATAPHGGNIVAIAWNADESSLFLGLEHGAERASIVSISAR